MELIAEGAESKIFKLDNTTLKKIREKKLYRVEELDNKLRKARNKREFKVLTKLYDNKINVPKPIEINDSKDDTYITFEYIKGNILKQKLTNNLLKKAFDEIIKMHNLGIIHGDLTTLNMLTKDNQIFLIDFGLSEFSDKVEERAVDLNLFFNCIKNEHPDFYNQKESLLKTYSKKVDQKVLDRLNKIEMRGRNK